VLKKEVLRVSVGVVISVLVVAALFVPRALFVSGAQGLPKVIDPTPGYFETSEYMIGRVAVGLIFVESNGTIDPDTEDWNVTMEQVLTAKIQHALDWWGSQNPSADVSFVVETHFGVPTGYEPISHASGMYYLWVHQVMADLGYGNDAFQLGDYVNYLRATYRADWGFIIFVVAAFNAPGGCFADGYSAFVFQDRISRSSYEPKTVVLPSVAPGASPYAGTTDDIDWIAAHEIGHVFRATDEYNNITNYSGYSLVPDITNSGCLMDHAEGVWCLSGRPDGLRGTWGQVGWRDSNENGIPDIVDTPQLIYFDSAEVTGNRINVTGLATVTTVANMEGGRNVTVNRIESVQFRIDAGEWQNATTVPYTFKVLTMWPDTYIQRETNAVLSFAFVTSVLASGSHYVELKATNQWGISGYANMTAEVKSYLSTDLNQDGAVNIQDITIVAVAYGSKPGDPNWNVKADLNNDDRIDMADLMLVTNDFGKID